MIGPPEANCSATPTSRSTRPRRGVRTATSSSIPKCRPTLAAGSGSNSICVRRWPSEQFRLVYQPIYYLDELTVVGVEALLRWEHPTDGLLAPDEFIPILEQTGQIREVGAWVLRQACAQMAAWHALGIAHSVSVNVSGRQLDDDKIVEHIRHALSSAGLRPEYLTVEVTETALMRDTESAVRRLRAIKDLGVSVAVDDFGTGYSSLAYLQQFPVDCIKIDKSFTSAMVGSAESEALDADLRPARQGSRADDSRRRRRDHRARWIMLRSDHVDEAQGYLFRATTQT